MIQLVDLNKYFEEKHVLKNINASFLPGVTNLVIGASGGGKSVMVKTMVGLESPSSGQVLFEGQDYHNLEYEQQQILRREIGMLFQGTALFDSLTVEQNVEFPLLMFSNMNKEERMERVNLCLSRVNLVNANNKTPAEISGGMKKRVGIARAIALNIKYLFCDEPNSGLDPLTSRVIDALLHDITKEFGITTIINSHDMKTVKDIGEHIVFVHQGQKWWEGNKDDLAEAQKSNPELDAFVKASF
ncbi:MAG: ATP-binding cassette domain-containing protein [Bacteroidetes bacterium]|nr:ATP-binding cassette domain-containing protein [Bacteroidota bacterium]